MPKLRIKGIIMSKNSKLRNIEHFIEILNTVRNDEHLLKSFKENYNNWSEKFTSEFQTRGAEKYEELQNVKLSSFLRIIATMILMLCILEFSRSYNMPYLILSLVFGLSTITMNFVSVAAVAYFSSLNKKQSLVIQYFEDVYKMLRVFTNRLHDLQRRLSPDKSLVPDLHIIPADYSQQKNRFDLLPFFPVYNTFGIILALIVFGVSNYNNFEIFEVLEIFTMYCLIFVALYKDIRLFRFLIKAYERNKLMNDLTDNFVSWFQTRCELMNVLKKSNLSDETLVLLSTKLSKYLSEAKYLNYAVIIASFEKILQNDVSKQDLGKIISLLIYGQQINFDMVLEGFDSYENNCVNVETPNVIKRKGIPENLRVRDEKTKEIALDVKKDISKTAVYSDKSVKSDLTNRKNRSRIPKKTNVTKTSSDKQKMDVSFCNTTPDATDFDKSLKIRRELRSAESEETDELNSAKDSDIAVPCNRILLPEDNDSFSSGGNSSAISDTSLSHPISISDEDISGKTLLSINRSDESEFLDCSLKKEIDGFNGTENMYIKNSEKELLIELHPGSAEKSTDRIDNIGSAKSSSDSKIKNTGNSQFQNVCHNEKMQVDFDNLEHHQLLLTNENDGISEVLAEGLYNQFINVLPTQNIANEVEGKSNAVTIDFDAQAKNEHRIEPYENCDTNINSVDNEKTSTNSSEKNQLSSGVSNENKCLNVGLLESGQKVNVENCTDSMKSSFVTSTKTTTWSAVEDVAKFIAAKEFNGDLFKFADSKNAIKEGNEFNFNKMQAKEKEILMNIDADNEKTQRNPDADIQSEEKEIFGRAKDSNQCLISCPPQETKNKDVNGNTLEAKISSDYTDNTTEGNSAENFLRKDLAADFSAKITEMKAATNNTTAESVEHENIFMNFGTKGWRRIEPVKSRTSDNSIGNVHSDLLKDNSIFSGTSSNSEMKENPKSFQNVETKETLLEVCGTFSGAQTDYNSPNTDSVQAISPEVFPSTNFPNIAKNKNLRPKKKALRKIKASNSKILSKTNGSEYSDVKHIDSTVLENSPNSVDFLIEKLNNTNIKSIEQPANHDELNSSTGHSISLFNSGPILGSTSNLETDKNDIGSFQNSPNSVDFLIEMLNNTNIKSIEQPANHDELNSSTGHSISLFNSGPTLGSTSNLGTDKNDIGSFQNLHHSSNSEIQILPADIVRNLVLNPNTIPCSPNFKRDSALVIDESNCDSLINLSGCSDSWNEKQFTSHNNSSTFETRVTQDIIQKVSLKDTKSANSSEDNENFSDLSDIENKVKILRNQSRRYAEKYHKRKCDERITKSNAKNYLFTKFRLKREDRNEEFKQLMHDAETSTSSTNSTAIENLSASDTFRKGTNKILEGPLDVNDAENDIKNYSGNFQDDKFNSAFLNRVEYISLNEKKVLLADQWRIVGKEALQSDTSLCQDTLSISDVDDSDKADDETESMQFNSQNTSLQNKNCVWQSEINMQLKDPTDLECLEVQKSNDTRKLMRSHSLEASSNLLHTEEAKNNVNKRDNEIKYLKKCRKENLEELNLPNFGKTERVEDWRQAVSSSVLSDFQSTSDTMPVGTSDDSAFHFHDSTSFTSTSASALTNFEYKSEQSENEISYSEDNNERSAIRWKNSMFSTVDDNLNHPSDPQNCKIAAVNNQSVTDARELQPLRYRLKHENLDLEISDASSSVTIRFINEKNGNDCENNFKFRNLGNKSISSSTSTVCSTNQSIVLPTTVLRSGQSEFSDITIEENHLKMCVRPETSDAIPENNSQSKNRDSSSFSQIPESKCILSKTEVETTENEESTSQNTFQNHGLFHRMSENYTHSEFEEVSPILIPGDRKDSVEMEYHVPHQPEAKKEINGDSSMLVDAKLNPMESESCSSKVQYANSGAEDNTTDLLKEFNTSNGNNNKSLSSVTNETNENCPEDNTIHASHFYDQESQVQKKSTENVNHAESMSISDSVDEEQSNDFVFETDSITLRYQPDAPTDSVDVKFRRQANQTKLTFKSAEKKLYVKMTP